MAELPLSPGALAVALAAALNRAGLQTPPERTAGLARALVLMPPVDRDGLYWVCRVSLVNSRAELPVFDAVFAAVVDGRLELADTRRDAVALPPPRGAATGDRAHAAFADVDPRELAAVRDLVRRLVLASPDRMSRPAPGRGLDVRRTVAAAQRRGHDVERLLFSQRRTRQHPLVLLCDVSGSMEPYARAFLPLLQGAVADASAEAFVFATGIARLTRQLTSRDPDSALARAAAVVTGWSGRTRLAASIEEFVTVFGRRGMAREAVVVVLSDGWTTEPPEELAAAMARLRRLAHRIVWVDPRASAPDVAPPSGGMAAALPFCDAVVSGCDLAALEEVVEAVGAARR